MASNDEPEEAMESEIVVKALRAARMGNAKAVKEALEKGDVTVDSFDSKGDTLLHAAASQGHRSIVKDLFRRGADPKALNFSGKTAHEVAHELNYWELGDYMREKIGLEKLGPPRWKGEPGGGALDDESLKEINERRDRAQKLKLSLGKLAEVDFDVVLSVVSQADGEGPAQLTAELESEVRVNVDRLRERLGDRPKLLKVEAVLESLWNRFSVHKLSVLDDGSGNSRATTKLDAELKTLREQMRGCDIEGLIGLVKKAEAAQEETTERCDFLLKSLGEEKTLKENLERLLQESNKELEKAHKATRDERDEVEKARKEAAEMKDAVGGVTSLQSQIISSTELQRLAERHSAGQAGVAPGALSAFLADLLKEADAKLSASREETEAERRKVQELKDKAEAEASERFEHEKQLKEKIATLEVQLAQDEGKSNSEAVAELEQRIASIREDYEARLDTAMQSAKVSIAKAREEMQQDVQKAKHVAAEEYQVDRLELEEAVQKAKQRVGEVTGELHALQAEHKEALAKLKESQTAAFAAKEQVAALKEKIQSSASVSAVRAVAAFRDSLGTHRRALGEMKAAVTKASMGLAADAAKLSKELGHFCRFILPLPHQVPEPVRSASLSAAQIAAALAHVVPKYRAAVDRCREANSELQALKGSLRVHCRGGGGGSGAAAEAERMAVNFRGNEALSVLPGDGGAPREFEFDVVHPPGSSQKEVFEASRGLVQLALEGERVCVAAHGPGGSGKSHALFGELAVEAVERGLALRFLQEAFRVQKERAVLTRVQVGLSVAEVVNEHVTDLLSGRSQGVTVASDRLGRVTVSGLSEHAVEGAAKGVQLLQQSLQAAATRRGHHGHLLVTLSLRCKEKRVGGRASAGSLMLVDLAASDGRAKSESDGAGLKEVQHAQESLAAMHGVLQASAAGKPLSQSQYGGSALTKLLVDYVGGNGSLLLLVTLPLQKSASKAALDCLKFAQECRNSSRQAGVVGKPRPSARDAQGGGGKAPVANALASEKEAGRGKAEARAASVAGANPSSGEELRHLREAQEVYDDFMKRLGKVIGVGDVAGVRGAGGAAAAPSTELVQQNLKKVLQTVREELDQKDAALRSRDLQIRRLEEEMQELSRQLNVFPPGPAHKLASPSSSAHLGPPSSLARNFGVIEENYPQQAPHHPENVPARRRDTHMPHVNGADGRASVETMTRRSVDGGIKVKANPRSASVPPTVAQIIGREKKQRVGGQQLGARPVLPEIGGHR